MWKNALFGVSKGEFSIKKWNFLVYMEDRKDFLYYLCGGISTKTKPFYHY